jgi:hypothetical protein
MWELDLGPLLLNLPRKFQALKLAEYNVEVAESLLKEIKELMEQAEGKNLETGGVEELIIEAEALLEKARGFCLHSQNCVAGNTLAIEAQNLLKEAKEMLESMLG